MIDLKRGAIVVYDHPERGLVPGIVFAVDTQEELPPGRRPETRTSVGVCVFDADGATPVLGVAAEDLLAPDSSRAQR